MAADHAAGMRDGRLLLLGGQRQPARTASLALCPQIPIRLPLFVGQACLLERMHVGVGAAHHRLLAPQADLHHQAHRRADAGIVGRDLGQQGLHVDAVAAPALVALGVLVALVLVRRQAVVLGPADEARLVEPHRQATQKAQVGLDRPRRKLPSLPDLHHRLDMPLAQVAGIGRQLEAGVRVQFAEEASQEVGALVARLVRHGLLQRGVQRVEQLDQHVHHPVHGRPARRVHVQHLLGRLAGPVLAARRVLAVQSAWAGRGHRGGPGRAGG